MGLFNFSASQALIVTLIFILISPFFVARKKNILSESSPLSWAFPVVTSLFFVAIDFRGDLVTGGNIRYSGTLFCLAVFLVINGTTSVFSFSRKLFLFTLPLIIISISGSLYGRVNDGEMTGALPLAIPMLILLMKIPRIRANSNLIAGTKAIVFLCSLISVETIFVRLDLLPDKSVLVFSHEKSFVITLGLLLSIAIKSKILISLNALLILISFALYPAATLPIGFLVAFGTYFVANRRKNSFLRVMMLVSYFLVVFASIFSSKIIFSLSSSYFTLVGKANNSQYRTSLINAALIEIEKNPVFGTFFRGSATVQATVLGNKTYQLPVHNDYITLALCGGIFFLLLFLSIPIYINLKIFRLISSLQNISIQRRILIAFLASINVAFASSFANPILINPANSTILYCLIACVISLISSQNQRDPYSISELK
jgi:hypothetical protein